MNGLKLLAHPVRLRIVHAVRGGRTLTTSGLAEQLPDVSKATVYRHVDLLLAGGVLEVAAERRVRGAVERGYRLSAERADVSPAAAAAMTADDHRAAFAVAMTALIAEFGVYLDSGEADPARDLVGYRQHAVWLSPAELGELIADLRAALLPRLAQPAGRGRTRYLVSPIVFPAGTFTTDPAG